MLGQPDFTSNVLNNGGISATSLDKPFSVVVGSSSGKVFVADRSNHRVLRYDSLSTLSNGAAAESVLGQADFTSNSPLRGETTVAANNFFNPISLAIDSIGTLWVIDRANRILRFDNAAEKALGASADGVLGQADFTGERANRGGAIAANTLNEPLGIIVDSATAHKIQGPNPMGWFCR